MPLISRFDPWHSPLCTCPPKLTFNPYNGCDHRCVYCYATRYAIHGFSDCTPKKNLVQRLRREAKKLHGETIAIALSSDPYPTVEAKNGVTRTCIEILAGQDCRIQIVTKSNLVVRDMDLLKKVPSVVLFSITTDDDELAKKMETNAPLPSERLKAVEKVVQSGIPVAVRIDPVIPFVNEEPTSLIKTLAALGVKHVISSTYKVKTDNWQRLKRALPDVAARIEPLFFQRGERIGGNIYLPRDLRLDILRRVRETTLSNGLTFAVCREGMSDLNTATCDGSGLMGESELQD
jgi:DNA repair photolyase